MAYDVFIAYASPDAEFARGLFTILRLIGIEPFLDSEVLVASDEWPRKIQEAQDRSLLTVLLISERSEAAYFQKEEMLHALELMRRGTHRIVPVYLGSRTRVPDSVPYALRQIHGIFAEDVRSLPDVSQKIQAALSSSRIRRDWEFTVDTSTTLILTGCHFTPEAMDRPLAYKLRDAIEARSAALDRRKLAALVMGDWWFLHHSGYAGHRNVVSVGGPSMNGYSAMLAEQGKMVRCADAQRWVILRKERAWAVYGNASEDTREALDSFCSQDMEPYLREIWNG